MMDSNSVLQAWQLRCIAAYSSVSCSSSMPLYYSSACEISVWWLPPRILPQNSAQDKSTMVLQIVLSNTF
jgi:hypothetical protein